eukprot:Sspe_Gene.70550::Locus_41661_Transcript_1_1_Confidence_1.000_Length_496::g.70550::m.70550
MRNLGLPLRLPLRFIPCPSLLLLLLILSLSCRKFRTQPLQLGRLLRNKLLEGLVAGWGSQRRRRRCGWRLDREHGGWLGWWSSGLGWGDGLCRWRRLLQSGWSRRLARLGLGLGLGLV